jgi:hypothetical protein
MQTKSNVINYIQCFNVLFIHICEELLTQYDLKYLLNNRSIQRQSTVLLCANVYKRNSFYYFLITAFHCYSTDEVRNIDRLY